MVALANLEFYRLPKKTDQFVHRSLRKLAGLPVLPKVIKERKGSVKRLWQIIELRFLLQSEQNRQRQARKPIVIDYFSEQFWRASGAQKLI